jgi:hypothetical protein
MLTIVGVTAAMVLAGQPGCFTRRPDVQPPPPVFGPWRNDKDASTDDCPPDQVRGSESPDVLPTLAPRQARLRAGYDCEPEGCWAWAGWGARSALLGAAARIQVHAPRTDSTEHSLAEVALRGGADFGDVLEIGWSVSPRRHPDGRPHLLIQRWVHGEACEGDCGFQPWSSAYASGMDLTPWIGRAIHVGWFFWEERWWAWFEGMWLGWYEATVWDGRFRNASVAQWFGEVFFSGEDRMPAMGSGRFADQPGAARFDDVCDVPLGQLKCRPPRASIPRVTNSSAYSLRSVSETGFLYGGPGQPAPVTRPPPPSATNGGTPPATETSAPSPPR